MDVASLYRSILGAVCLAAIKQVDNYFAYYVTENRTCSSELVTARVVEGLQVHLDSRGALCPLTSPFVTCPAPAPCPALQIEEVSDRQLAVIASFGSAVGTWVATRIWNHISRRREAVGIKDKENYGVTQRPRRGSRIRGAGVLE